MINLLNIQVKDGIVCARAENRSNGIIEDVLAYKGGYYTNAVDRRTIV